MAGYLRIHHCPGCKKIVDTLPGGVWSGLGPSRYRCSRCGLVFHSGRREWADMGGIAKAKYIGISLLYVVVGGMMGGMSISAAVQIQRLGPGATRFRLDPLAFVLGTFVWTVVIAAIQIARLFLSLLRSRENEYRRMDLGKDSKRKVVAVDEPHSPTLWRYTKSGLLFLMLATILLSWLIAYIRTL